MRKNVAARREAAKEGTGATRPVLVLADSPPNFADRLGCPWLELACESTVGGFLERLGRQPVSGFVLDVDTVLRAAALERGLLFELAGAFPLLRVRSAGQGGLSLLDDPERFVLQVRGQAPRPARHVPRVPVLLRAELCRASPGQAGRLPELQPELPEESGALELSLKPRGNQFTCQHLGQATGQHIAQQFTRTADQASAQSAGQPALFLDLSACGGALGCEALLTPGEELHLRILELEDTAPVSALVCWSGQRGKRSGRRCAGVRFLNMRPGQARELAERRLCSAAV